MFTIDPQVVSDYLAVAPNATNKEIAEHIVEDQGQRAGLDLTPAQYRAEVKTLAPQLAYYTERDD